MADELFEHIDQVLQAIQQQYLQMVPLKDFEWKDLHSQLGVEGVQEKLLHLICYPYVKFNTSISYQRVFLKRLINVCEDREYEVADSLYELYGTVVSKVEDRSEACYKTYMLPCSCGIVVQESQQIISKGTTGLCTWQASLHLSEWVLENTETFNSRTIVELGCGLGLLGMIICSHCNPHSYIFSDLHHDVLSALTKNLELNSFSLKHCDTHFAHANKYDVTDLEASHKETKPKLFDQRFGLSTNTSNTNDGDTVAGITSDMASKISQGHEERSLKESEIYLRMRSCNLGRKKVISSKIDYLGCPNSETNESEVFVKQLDWTTATESELRNLKAGIILATDVIYDVDIIEPLLRVLHKLLSFTGDSSGKPVAIVTSTIRNPSTYQRFLELAGMYKLQICVLKPPVCQLFYYDRTCQIELIKLQLL